MDILNFLGTLIKYLAGMSVGFFLLWVVCLIIFNSWFGAKMAYDIKFRQRMVELAKLRGDFHYGKEA